MTTHPLISNATDSPPLLALSGEPAKSKRGEGLGRRAETVKLFEKAYGYVSDILFDVSEVL